MTILVYNKYLPLIDIYPFTILLNYLTHQFEVIKRN